MPPLQNRETILTANHLATAKYNKKNRGRSLCESGPGTTRLNFGCDQPNADELEHDLGSRENHLFRGAIVDGVRRCRRCTGSTIKHGLLVVEHEFDVAVQIPI